MPRFRYTIRSEYVSFHEITADTPEEANLKMDEWLKFLHLSPVNSFCESRKYDEPVVIDAQKQEDNSK